MITLGSTVEWSSQSNGSRTIKCGKVVAVVPPNGDPIAHLHGLQKLCFPHDAGSSRNHESYVVHVATKTGKGMGKLYWPRVSGLKVVGNG